MRTRERIGVGDALMLPACSFHRPVSSCFRSARFCGGVWAARDSMQSSISRSHRGSATFSGSRSRQAAVSTALTVAVALPAAATVGGLSDRARRFVRSLVTVPFVLPTVVVAGAFDELFFATGLDTGDFRLRHTRLGDPDRPRLLQLCGRCAGRGHCVRRTRRSSSGGCESARRNSLAGVAGGDAAAASAGDCLSLGDRLPFLVHVVRCSADPGWPQTSDPGDGNLPVCRQPHRSDQSSRVGGGAARSGACAGGGVDLARTAPSCDDPNGAPDPNTGIASGPMAERRHGHRSAWCSARRPHRTLVFDRHRLRALALPSARHAGPSASGTGHHCTVELVALRRAGDCARSADRCGRICGGGPRTIGFEAAL